MVVQALMDMEPQVPTITEAVVAVAVGPMPDMESKSGNDPTPN